MARGLSDLQKWILKEAATRPKSIYHEVKILTISEICKDYYDFPYGGKKFNPYTSYHFYKNVVGVKKYNAAMVAIHKTFARLEKRGLVMYWRSHCKSWQGVSITDAGINVLANLSASDADRLAIKSTSHNNNII